MTITNPLSSSSSSSTSNVYSSSSSSSNFDSYQNRNQNALQRRAQQLRRWREIEEMEQKKNLSDLSKTKAQTRVCFSPATLFLSACSQNDIEECERLLRLKELRDAGGVNVTNCDGLTALHQACIDDNEPIVLWLLSKSANINCKDNEGWTPLHASASCGNHNIVNILISHPDCDILSLNCDNELACDVCESKECENLIRFKMNEALGCENKPLKLNISGDDEDEEEEEENQAFKDLRQLELKSIERDISNWINSSNINIKNEFERTRDPLSGATILHVCAAKGYNEILNKLLITFANQFDLDSFRDCDGYTALHAAAFWKQPETFETLLKFGANPELQTEKTSENIISSSVLELCKNDPKFVQLIEIKKEKEKIAKESETQRKIFAKRQREIRRSTQGVKKEDLEKALKIMEISKSSTDSSEKDFNNIMMKVNNTETLVPSNETSGDTPMTTDSVEMANNETDTTCWTIRLPSKTKSDVDQSDNNLINEKQTNSSLTTESLPSVTMTISSATPTDYGRKRRIKRRATGIEDDSGHALSPDCLPDSTNPFTPTETVDASFDVILSSPSNQTRSRLTRPVSNASSTTSLNSLRSACDSDDKSSVSGASSLKSLDCIGQDFKSQPYSRNNNSNASYNNSNNNSSNNIQSSASESALKEVLQNSTTSSDEIDYKKLCKQLIRENESLRHRLKELEEAEKKREQEFSRERRSLQRTISEQEEELKGLHETKADNTRLKDENAALIRVISKLSK